MAKALSTDLRRRVVDATAQGMSCRQAAERFGVSASSAIRWQQRFERPARLRRAGRAATAAPKRIEAHIAGDPRTCGRDAGHHPCRDQGDAGGVQGERWDWHALAVLQPPQDHAQKKTAHAAEQHRPDILKRPQGLVRRPA